MMWTDERGRDQPGSPEDKIQVLTAPYPAPSVVFGLELTGRFLMLRSSAVWRN